MQLKRYRGQWCAYWRESGRPRRRSLRLDGTADREAAARALADYRRQIQLAARPNPTVAEIFAAYLADKDEVGKPTKRDREAWVPLKPHFARLRPAEITRLTCRAYTKTRRNRGVRDSTINKELRTLRAAVNFHRKDSGAVFDMPSGRPRPKRYLTHEEYRELRRAALAGGAFHAYLYFTLAVATCARPAAILDLTWDRVDFARNLIVLAAQGDEGRKGRATVPMTRLARAALHRARRGALSAHVIEWAGQPVKSVKHAVGNAARRAGLDDVTPSCCRRSGARWMVEAGVRMAEVAQYLGHADSEITEREYARFSPAYLAGAAEALSGAVRAGRVQKNRPGPVLKRVK